MRTHRRAATVLAAGALALTATPGDTRAQTPAADSVAVIATVLGFHGALARRDSAAALALLADDAVILESGGIETREEYRAHHLSADIEFAAAVTSRPGSFRATVAGDVAWASSTSETTGTFNGRPVNSTGAELVVLTRSGTEWRIRAIHWSSRRRAGP